MSVLAMMLSIVSLSCAAATNRWWTAGGFSCGVVLVVLVHGGWAVGKLSGYHNGYTELNGWSFLWCATWGRDRRARETTPRRAQQPSRR